MYPASAQTRRTPRQARCRFHSSGRAPWRSWTEAGVITTSRTRPVVSTAMWRLRPLTFLALSQPRLALGTVSAARTDWESMTAAVGWGWRPAAALTWARSCAVQPGQGAIIAPGGEVAVDGLPGREVAGQIPPGASGAVQVQDRLHDPAGRPDPRPPPAARHIPGQVRGDHLPLRIGQVTGIAPGSPPRQTRTVGTRGPHHLDRHTSGSWGPRLASEPSDTPPDHRPRPGQHDLSDAH